TALVEALELLSEIDSAWNSIPLDQRGLSAAS
ncbi:flagellar protein FliS, partial [Xanthomonas arboricola pv. pruni str. MAFF 311562]